MKKRPTRLWPLALPLACALLVAAGCGGESEADEVNADPPSEASERPGEAPENEETDGDLPEELEGPARRALDACRQVVERAPGISEEAKRELIADCEAAAAGDEEAIRSATRAACDVIAAATAPPLLRGQVAAACKRVIPGSAL